MALHRRDVYFWSLGSTWTSLIAGPAAIVIMSQSVWSRLHDPNAPLFMVPMMAGLMLYAVALAYALFYNFRATKSTLLAFSTCMLQQLAVLGLMFIWLRWDGNRVNRGRR
jgi:UDP-N-acetylmuramyl pentapeptide phosphotransferase/UDP-N-acetylglucosamine-1-phosphate transferase